MVRLEKMVCPQISDEAREAYEGLASNNEDGRFVNTTFELEVKPANEFLRSIKETFDDL